MNDIDLIVSESGCCVLFAW